MRKRRVQKSRFLWFCGTSSTVADVAPFGATRGASWTCRVCFRRVLKSTHLHLFVLETDVQLEHVGLSCVSFLVSVCFIMDDDGWFELSLSVTRVKEKRQSNFVNVQTDRT